MLVKTLYIVSFERGGGHLGPPLKSAKGLFQKYSDRPGTDAVVWYHVKSKGVFEEKARWERSAAPHTHERLRAEGLLRPAPVAVPAAAGNVPAAAGVSAAAPGGLPKAVQRKPEVGADDAGAYVVAHASDYQVAQMGAYAIAGILAADLKLPMLRKIVFIACHAAEHDETAANDVRQRDVKIKGDDTKPGQWVHGLDQAELSFITMFACCYGETLKDPKKVFVAGWDCAVSIAEGTKDVATELPEDFKANAAMDGKKIINQGGGWKFPTAGRHRKAKKMFCWSVQGGQTSTVSKVERAQWSDKA
ncbi:hypothetical protein LJR290_005982 [Variovorax sp. LjRoot290]|uniref:hypothetical protein n=1 Tax=Variovorax sp. LjRoot290 TaxID=3342316 RepID=UPI003ECD5F3F